MVENKTNTVSAFTKSASGEAWGSTPEWEPHRCVGNSNVWSEGGTRHAPSQCVIPGERDMSAEGSPFQRLGEGWEEGHGPSVCPARAGQTECLKLFLSEGQPLKHQYIP